MQTFKPTAKPSKQRRMIYQAPDHLRRKLFAAPLSAELRASRGTKSLPVRNGDTVRIMRGDHKGFEGKITRVDRSGYRIYVEGLTREKVDGTSIFVPVHPSKVTLTGLVLDDKWRRKILERKKQARKGTEKAEVKHLEETVKTEEVTKKEPIEKKAAPKKKPKAKKPRAQKKAVAEKTAERKTEKEEKIEIEQEPKTKKQRAVRKNAKKLGGA